VPAGKRLTALEMAAICGNQVLDLQLVQLAIHRPIVQRRK
jgi:hypothetical protein